MLLLTVIIQHHYVRGPDHSAVSEGSENVVPGKQERIAIQKLGIVIEFSSLRAIEQTNHDWHFDEARRREFGIGIDLHCQIGLDIVDRVSSCSIQRDMSER